MGLFAGLVGSLTLGFLVLYYWDAIVFWYWVGVFFFTFFAWLVFLFGLVWMSRKSVRYVFEAWAAVKKSYRGFEGWLLSDRFF